MLPEDRRERFTAYAETLQQRFRKDMLKNLQDTSLWVVYAVPITRKVVRPVVLSSTGDFFIGMATAWAFASYDAIFRKAWINLLLAFLLAILALVLSIGIKIQTYDKYSRSH